MSKTRKLKAVLGERTRWFSLSRKPTVKTQSVEDQGAGPKNGTGERLKRYSWSQSRRDQRNLEDRALRHEHTRPQTALPSCSNVDEEKNGTPRLDKGKGPETCQGANTVSQQNFGDNATAHTGNNFYNIQGETVYLASAGPSKMSSTPRLRADSVSETRRNGLFEVPFGRNELFVGRETIMAKLLDRIPPTKFPEQCQRSVLVGLGGRGKTQIALEAAYRLRKEDPSCSIFWVPMMDVAIFEKAYRGIGSKLKIEGIESQNADVKALVRDALDDHKVGRWLLIFDNADDPELFSRKQADGKDTGTDLRTYFPSSHHGSILFTSRTRQVASKLGSVWTEDIMSMDKEDALSLLERLVQHKFSLPDDKAAAIRLLELLDHLPLAIRQAAAFMTETGKSAMSYLQMYEKSDSYAFELLSEDFEDNLRYDRKTNPIATTWLISIEHVQKSNPQAANSLKCMCFYAQQDIPVELLSKEEDIKTTKAMGLLKGYGFITEREHSKTYDMHRLFRLAMQNWLRQKRWFGQYATVAMQRLASVYPSAQTGNRDEWMPYLPHAVAALEFADEVSGERATKRVLQQVGWSQFWLGKYREAEKWGRQALELHGRRLHQPTQCNEAEKEVDCRRLIAAALQEQSRYEDAEEMLRPAVELASIDSVEGIRCQIVLAIVLVQQGKNDEAKAICDHLLGTVVVDENSDDALDIKSILASLLNAEGKHAQAEKMHREIYAASQSKLGDDHPNTLTDKHNIAYLLLRQGKCADAEGMLREVIPVRKRVLGPVHPDTLRSQQNLGYAMYGLDKVDEAEAILQTTLADMKRVLGLEHDWTRLCIQDLANVLSKQRKHDAADAVRRELT